MLYNPIICSTPALYFFLDLHSIRAEIKRDYSPLCGPCKFMEIHLVAFDTAESVTSSCCSDCVTSFAVTKSLRPILLISPRQHVEFFVICFFFSCRCTRSSRTTLWSQCPTRRRSKWTEPSLAAPCSSTRRPASEHSCWWAGLSQQPSGACVCRSSVQRFHQNHLCSWMEVGQASWFRGAREQLDWQSGA